MTSASYLRHPHIHGDLLVFVAEDDIWLSPAAGGRASRLSSDAAQAAFPRFSRDGALVAWTSWRDGDPEVYTVDVEGGAAARCSYWGDNRTRVTGWTSDGEVLAVSAAGQAATHLSWAYALGADGPPRQLPYGPVVDLAIEADATALLTGRPRDMAYWKRYRGGTAGRLWVATADDPLFSRVLGDFTSQLSSPMLIAGRLFFLSDHEGTGNIYSCELDGTSIRRHTDHDGWYARNPSTDGERIVYHAAGDIWMLDGPDAGAPHKLDITLASPAAARAPRLITAEDSLGDVDVDATGQASVVEVRGTVHWLTHKDGPARALHVSQDARARLPRVLGDRVVWVTDATGADSLEVVSTQGEAVPVRLADGLLGSVTSLAASPDGSTIAAATREGRLLTVNAESGAVSEVASADDGQPTGLAWSPDSAWLAWSQPGPKPLSRIRMLRVADGEVFDVTDARFTDTEPVFTPEGKYLAFLSQRSFDPVYDAHSFDLAFPFGARPYLVTLAAGTASPFGPLPGGRPLADENDDKDKVEVTVDPDGISSRVVPVPVTEGRYSSLAAVKGGLAWLRDPLSGVLGEGGAEPSDDRPRSALERFDLRKREITTIVDELDWFCTSGDGTRLVVRDRGDLRVLPQASKPDADGGDSVSIDLSRARFTVDPAALWRHAFDEVGRLMRRDFWTPDMSGVDWDAVLAGYRPLTDRLRGPGDFEDLIWELVGELGTSHAYVLGTASSPARGPVGQLGADLSRDEAGRWIVDRILPGESSDPLARSPLAAPGVVVRPGDEIVAVDGQRVDPARGPWPLLTGTVGRPTELTIRTGDQTRRAVVVPLRDERRLRYQDQVATRRRMVRELSDGRIGYLHIPDMMGEGWAHFHRDLRTEMIKDALIVDVRANRGGHTSELIIEQIGRRVIGWDTVRHLKPVTYPTTAPRGPVVALADEYSGSDGDIVTAAIQALGIGPVVGARTWGGVIGIDGMPGNELVDGTHVTVPRYAFAFNELGWDVENYGVDPDVEVLITPDDWAAGRDPQLETAVRLAVEALADRPAAAPPDPSTAPRKARPPLPPRASR